FAVEERWLKRGAPPPAGPAVSLVAARAAHERASSKPHWPSAAAACPAPRAQRPSWACRGRPSNRKSKPWVLTHRGSKRTMVTDPLGIGQQATASGRTAG